jgi:hypothetical protein
MGEVLSLHPADREVQHVRVSGLKPTSPEEITSWPK